jgi:putative membrane protein insertion efficiency factor
MSISDATSAGDSLTLRLPSLVVRALISVYRAVLSPLLGPACRFAPSCSAYADEAIRRYGLLRGGRMAVKRILRCHPFHPGGFDPVR